MTWRREDVLARVSLPAVLALVIGQPGCGQPAPTFSTQPIRFDGTKLVVGVVGDLALLKSVATQRGEWVARTGSDLVLRDAPVDPETMGDDVDVLVFPGERLGDLVDAGAVAVLPESLVSAPPTEPSTETAPVDSESRDNPSVDPFKFQDVAPAFRDQVSKYGPDRYGLPIGGSALVVVFRRTAMDDPTLAEAAKVVGLTLKPPQTWDQFDALARFFHGRDLDGDNQPDSGVALPWGLDPEGVGDAIFLARTASSALHPDQYSFLLDSETTEPRVTTPPYVESLQALVALKAFGPPGGEKFDAPTARAAFKSGRVALLIDRAEAASTWGTGQTPIGVAPLPGSNRVFDPSRNTWETNKGLNRPSYLPSGGGWLVGISSKTTHKTAAEAFARYLADPDTSDRLRAERGFPMLPVRTSQMTQGMANPRSAPGVEPRPWAEAVARTLGAEKVVPGLRVPQATGYLADLSLARVAAANGQAAEEALQTLAGAWSKRTQALGPARQTWHHRRSLNGPSTATEPPPR